MVKEGGSTFPSLMDLSDFISKDKGEHSRIGDWQQWSLDPWEMKRSLDKMKTTLMARRVSPTPYEQLERWLHISAGTNSFFQISDIVEGVRKVQKDDAGNLRYLRPSLTVSNASDGASGGGGCVSGSSAPSKRDPNVLPQAELTQLMQECWSEDPRERPDFASLRARIKELNKYAT